MHWRNLLQANRRLNKLYGMITYTFVKEQLDESMLHSPTSHANLEFAKICQHVSKSRAAVRLSAPYKMSSANVMLPYIRVT